MSATNLSKFFRAIRTLRDDTDGVILPYVTLMLVVIIGVSMLALDGARVVSLQTQLQKAADALALAGAAELDQSSDSITRATNAINNLVTNRTLPGLEDQAVTFSAPRFLASLPASDATAIAAGNVTTDPLLARYVEVVVTPVQLTNILPASFFGGANKTSGAQAVAGRGDIVVCGIPPVFICNPYETAGMTDAAATAALDTAMNNRSEWRRQWKLNASNTGPGQFGWLVPPDGATGAAALGDWIGRTQPNACYKGSGVSLNTGEKQGANAGFNVRFDLYEGGNPLNAPSSAYAPSVNVRKGYVWHNPNWCSAVPVGSGNAYYTDPGVRGLPRDTGFSGASNFMGNAQWDCGQYWDINHTAARPAVAADGSAGVCGNSTSTTLSRYDVYRYEIANNLVGTTTSGNDWSGNRQLKLANNGPNSSGTGESGAPLCAGAGNGVDTSTGGADRRIVYSAIINCLAQGPFPSGSNATNVPVAGFGKFFMTQPIFADGDSTRPLYGEFQGFVKLGQGVGVYATIQLYR